MIYADTSALVKLYADEDGSLDVRALADPFVTSTLTQVEVISALWRKHRRSELGVESVGLLAAEFWADVRGVDRSNPRFHLASPTAEVLTEAARLIGRHQLRAYDAVQLSTAIIVAATTDTVGEFAAFDRHLRRAAVAEGFTVVPNSTTGG